MALRSKAFVTAGVLICAARLAAQPWEFAARQDRLLRDKAATVKVDESGIGFARKDFSRRWAWDDIQQLTLSPKQLRVLTYADARWKAGRDREWTFERLPEGMAAELQPFLEDRLGARLVTAMAAPAGELLWQVPAKLRQGLGGPEGTLEVRSGTVVYRTTEGDRSRTWRIEHIEGVSSAGPFDLAITTAERGGLLRDGFAEFRFQLKRPMAAEQYQELWRGVHRSKGLHILNTLNGESTQ